VGRHSLARRIADKRLWGGLAVAYVTFTSFTGPNYGPISTGLDYSWRYGLNYLAQSHYTYGRDVTFTYGPLGYLVYPLDIGANLSHAIIFSVIMQILLAAILLYFVFALKKSVPVLLFAVAYAVTCVVGLFWLQSPEFLFLSRIALCFCASLVADNRIGYCAAPIGGVLAGMSLFVKSGVGEAALVMLVVFCAMFAVRNRRAAWRVVLLSSVAYLLTVSLLSAHYFHSYHDFAVWVRASYELSAGYSVAMSSSATSHWLLVVGLPVLVSLGAYTGWLLLSFRKRSRLSLIGVVLLVSVVFGLRYGLVRQDGHQLIFFVLLLNVLCLLILASSNTRELKVGAICFVTVLVLTLPYFGQLKMSSAVASDPALAHAPISERLRTTLWSRMIPDATGLLSGQRAWSYVSSLIHLGNTREALHISSAVRLKADALPTQWVNEISSHNGTVDVVPWEICYCPANNLHWNPNPVLQTYSAYTPYLDDWSARHYEGANAPDFLIVDFKDIDGRHVLMDAPATTRSIISNYELDQEDSQANRTLLQRKGQPLEVDLEAVDVIKTEDGYVNQWISVPSSNYLLFVDVDMRLTLWGRAMKTAYRIPPVNIDLIYDSGKYSSYRIIPDTAKDGLLINYLPSSSEELSQLLAGISNDRVAMFRISGPGAAYYQRKISLSWEQLTRTIEYREPEHLNPQELALVPGSTLFHVDRVDGGLLSELTSPIVVNTKTQNVITISGWAVDANSGSPAGGVFINVDDRMDIQAYYGVERPDVAEHFGISGYRFSGFSVAFPASMLDNGQHVLTLKIVTAGKKEYYRPDQSIVIEIK